MVGLMTSSRSLNVGTEAESGDRAAGRHQRTNFTKLASSLPQVDV